MTDFAFLCSLEKRIEALEKNAAPAPARGVTVEELAWILDDVNYVHAGRGCADQAHWMLQHPRIGPLLRGEGQAPGAAPVRVVLPEEPPGDPLPIRGDDGYWLVAATWAAARAEVERQQLAQPVPVAPPEDEAALAARPALAHDPHESLAARPLLEQVARMGDRIGQHTVGEILVLSDRAAAWLAQNPPGQPVAIEPRGCPIPGACACVEPATAPPADGEAEELAALMEQDAECLEAEQPDLMSLEP